jgi:hypothetical protein
VWQQAAVARMRHAARASPRDGATHKEKLSSVSASSPEPDVRPKRQ